MSEARSGSVSVPAGADRIQGDLAVPAAARGIVLFAHGSGSSRFSPRNRQVAGVLREAGLATLMLDLLTAQEERVNAVTRQHRFDIGLLSMRLVAAVDWVAAQPEIRDLRVGCFGASTGAAAALIAAAERPVAVAAVVSRGGRPDLAGPRLADVRAPTLLIVGGLDAQVLDLNLEAIERLECEKRLEVVPGATHLFEEPGTLDRVAELARDWFLAHMSAPVSQAM